jgi:hypothetical protein
MVHMRTHVTETVHRVLTVPPNLKLKRDLDWHVNTTHPQVITWIAHQSASIAFALTSSVMSK